ncbi:CBS domain-containing protein [Bradyrhizobium sp. HKCCYLS3077]|uniref:CBS domain-containing protein n=1 Tax=Bradyrhizobium sp. HKCCYLS3077 TaxID=3420761 RepID=UPI003EBEA5BB
MRAHQIMTRSVITVTPGTPVAEAARIMLRNHIGGLPVVDASGQLVGIVTDGDFLRRAELGTERRSGRWLDLLVGRGRIGADFVHSHGRTVGDIMSRPPVTVSPDAALAEIAETMETRSVKRLPVVSSGHLVGMITHTDFVQTLADLATTVPGPTPDDDGLRSAVLDALDQAACKHCRFNVVVRNGIAHLSGAVRHEKERATAIVAAKSVEGVREVRDHMWVYPPPEDEFGGGDIVSLQEEPSTDDDQPL